MLFRRGRITNVAAYAGSSSGLDAATTAWVAAVVAASGTVSGTQQTRVDTLIKALKAGGVFSIWDAMWLLDAENTQQTQISLTTGNPTWTVFSGTISLVAAGTKSNASGVINTGINLSLATNYKQNSGTLLAYTTTADTTSNGAVIAGRATAWGGIGNNGAGSSVGSGINIVAGDANSISFGATTSNLVIGTRTGPLAADDVTYYWNSGNSGGISNSSSGDASQPPPNEVAFILAANISGTASNLWSGTLGVAAIGSGVNSTQAAAIAAALNAYETARGNNAW